MSDANITGERYVNEVVNDASLASGAVILTYNPPANATAHVYGISVFAVADSAVVDVILVSSSASADITIMAFTTSDMAGLSAYQAVDITLEDGDSLELEVTTVDASVTGDLAVFAVERNR